MAPAAEVRTSSKRKFNAENGDKHGLTKRTSKENTPSPTDAAAYYEKHSIIIHGDTDLEFPPCLDFSAAAFSSKLMHLVSEFKEPTPIQAACWPALCAGRDLVGIAETGSGKTLAFGLPALTHAKNGNSIKVLVLAPTRELALQTYQVLAKHTKTNTVCVYGGVPKHEQRQALAKAHIVIATPGRILDFIQEDSVDLARISLLVLDEADRMLDFGFEQDVRTIVQACTNEQRQTVMFSATWPQSVRTLAAEFMRPQGLIRVHIGNVDQLAANTRIEQHVLVLDDPRDKDPQLLSLLRQVHRNRDNRVLVFALYKKEAARLEAMLNKNGWNACAIHGDKGQRDREQALEAFRNGSCPLLVATDVAARGLDIPGVEFVINYTFPLTIEDYVHRIGRTGRGGKHGVAHTFFTTYDKAHAGALRNVLQKAGATIPEALNKFGGTVKKKENKNYGAFYREVDPTVKGTKIVFSD